MESTGEDEISLPSDTLAILNEFLREKAQREHEEQERILGKSGKDSMFEEDWQLSQFWYSEKTKDALATVVQKLIKNDFRIALLSCPSLYNTIKNIHSNLRIFEFDKRFSAFGDDFVFYDFNQAEEANYLSEHYGLYDLVIADPPFLSEECITKISQIIKMLIKPNEGKVIFCSGETVEPWVTQCLDLKRCKFQPEHERNLGNEFVSYANFNLDEFL